MHVAPIYLQHTPRFGACQVVARNFLQRVRCSRNGVATWHANDAKFLQRVCGLFSGRFRAVCEAFATPVQRCQRVTLFARPRMGPILRPVFEPNPTPFRKVPVKLAPSPFTRHFRMGPILGLRFFAHDRPSRKGTE